MEWLVDGIARYCVKEGILTSQDISWFKYGLEKRISTILVGIPFLIIAFMLSDFLCAISFFITYFFVRKYLGGYHAKTVWGCVAFSLSIELIFLGVLKHILNLPVIFAIIGISIIATLKLAPYYAIYI